MTTKATPERQRELARAIRKAGARRYWARRRQDYQAGLRRGYVLGLLTPRKEAGKP